jgi:hypothetical protein
MDSSHEDLPYQIVSGMVRELVELLSSCGAGKSTDNSNKIHKYAGDRLGSLFAAARKLNRMIGENVVSDDLKVTVIRGGEMFDFEQMEDAYAWGGIKSDQRVVICTTDLGLCERNAARGGKMLLKPKVALRNL